MMKLGHITGTIEGKVIYGGVKQSQTKSGKDFEILTLGVQLANKVTVFVTNRKYESSLESPFIKKRIDDMMDVIDNYKDTDYYVRLRLSPDKKSGTNKYGKLSTYISQNDNRLAFSAEGFIDIVEHEEENGEVYLIHYNQRNEAYKTKFEDSLKPFIIEGYVETINDDCDEIRVIDGSDSYGQNWNISINPEIGKQLVVGQGYAFKTEIQRGKPIEKKSSEESFDFSSSFSINNLNGRTEFSSDKFVAISGGKLQNQSMNIQSSENVSTNDTDLPF